MKELNVRVTEAILAAENHDREGVRLWEAVASCEREIAESIDVSELEREIARRGVELALERARLLRDRKEKR